jgi:hypothetical protein
MAAPTTPAPGTLDHEIVAQALRSLGMLHGTRSALAPIPVAAGDQGELIRSYILRERPHLLKCYDLEALVGLVRVAIERRRHLPELEEFVPS